MASPGLLLLLLVSSSLLLSSVSADIENMIRSTGQMARKTISMFNDLGVPLLMLIPVDGKLISLCTKLGLGLLLKLTEKDDKSVADLLKSEFKSLNSKIDEYHAEQKWQIWAAAAFHNPEMEIKVAWDQFEILISSLPGKEEAEVKKLKDEFLENYIKAGTDELHKYLTTTGITLINNLGKGLVEELKCHEKDILGYTVLINSLIYKGNLMNHFSYQHKQTQTQQKIDHSAEIAYESSSVMFELYKSCVFNSYKYIEKEVKDLINDQKRRKLAHEVRSFLAETYDRYDWMVVAYKTKNSDHTELRSLNKHTLTGFHEAVTSGAVSVSFVRQVKGNHTMADKVGRAIQRCLTTTYDCHKVAEKLKECKEKVDGIELSKTYTAVHAFIDKAHQSYEAVTVPEQLISPYDTTVPYLYQGVCKKYKVSPLINFGGTFVVLIKSDEEIKIQDPCKDMKCSGDNREGDRGKCVPIPETFRAMCECHRPYYGEHCELSIDDYKKELQKELEDRSGSATG
ncbi:uncharacterized protein LOC119013322 [Acanthopagrus latus]|uniref:uncharacterized protein LOC119013322 n=1 Tax=Acanthopagrus latus TaxID=8177 RepID=UPI00187CCEC0|nr:uncharacterized protein LOC119013322 [Acanthopagrus latus]